MSAMTATDRLATLEAALTHAAAQWRQAAEANRGLGVANEMVATTCEEHARTLLGFLAATRKDRVTP